MMPTEILVMYDWRKMTPKERAETLAWRKRAGVPWHSPPHFDMGTSLHHVYAACYEHAPIVGQSAERLAQCETQLLEACSLAAAETAVWCVLPNHYHLLLRVENLKRLFEELKLFHGRTSFCWNGEDDARGRKVWTAAANRAIRSERHYWATVNYIHHNPVKHGLVENWTDWPYSSAAAFIAEMGRDEALRIWKAFPVLDYGKDWDV